MKVAAYQAPLLTVGSMGALPLIRERVKWCETQGIEILCCPEAILGGLADYAESTYEFAMDSSALVPLLEGISSQIVTTIIGFTEVSRRGLLYNSAAVFHRGSMLGIYRKLHPAINRSVYEPGTDIPVFTVGDLTFGIVICNDSNFPEVVARIAAKGATALFVPTNNALPSKREHWNLVGEARKVDATNAVQNSLWIIRADVAGRTDQLVSRGSSGIVDPVGRLVESAPELEESLIRAEI